MKLNDTLPETLSVDGTEYRVNLSFNNVLDILEVLNNEEISQTNKLTIITGLLLELDGSEEIPKQRQIGLFKAFREKYLPDESDETAYDVTGEPMPHAVTENVQLIDLEKDAPYIYASFRQIGINLFEEQERMHWEEFQALLMALPDDCIMQNIIRIRSYKPKKGDSSEYRNQMAELQRKYNLERGEDEWQTEK